MSVSSTLTGLADEVRQLSGESGKMTLARMTSEVEEANSEVSEQEETISEIVRALAGKAAGGGTGMPQIDETLRYSADGRLGVNTADVVEEDNTLPVTSAAVYAEMGNIEALLKTI